MFKLRRKVYKKSTKMPPYYLSVTYRDLQTRKSRWKREATQNRAIPIIKKWINNKYASNSGLIVKVDSSGIISNTVNSDFPHGILLLNDKLISASHHEINLHSKDLVDESVLYTNHNFNALHSLRKSKIWSYKIRSIGENIFYNF